MNSKLLFVFLFLCLILMTRAADEKAEEKTEEKTEDKTDTKNTDTEKADTTETKTTATGTTTKTTGTKAGEIVDEDSTNNNNNSGELEANVDTIANSNSTIDACGHTSKQLGTFSFHKPIAKSVVPIYTNFTVIWYYNNIIYDSYEYPTNNITLSLYFEKDANPNDWANAWKDPVWEETIPMSQISAGPVLTNNVRTYQWDWKLMYNDQGQDTSNFKQALRTNEKYKLRISGDGKDIQRNPELKCYKDGDISPGSTRAFYIVDNNSIPTYEPFSIPDGAFSLTSHQTMIQYLVPLLMMMLYLLWN